jgi:hypothetical protein
MTVQWGTTQRNAVGNSLSFGSADGSFGLSRGPWAQSTPYTAYTSWCLSGGYLFVAVASGTSLSSGVGPGATAPTPGTPITDGTVTWLYIGTRGFGPSLNFTVLTGSVPANPAASDPGTVLVNFALSAEQLGVAASGVVTMGSLPVSATASAAGTAAHYRIYDSTNTICVEQGTITLTGGGGDATIDSNPVSSGQTINLTSYSKTVPGA